MPDLDHLLRQNRAWAAERVRRDREFFHRLADQQDPNYLWIGCSDSRVPANEIVGLAPGQMFVHRNLANVVVHADLNALAVIQYAVEMLQVQHIIVCGHYRCGGVRAAWRNDRLGLAENWLRHVQDVRWKHQEELDALDGEDTQIARLCELNVTEQALNVSRTTIVQDAWARGQKLAVHGVIYDVADGLLRELPVYLTGTDDALAASSAARVDTGRADPPAAER